VEHGGEHEAEARLLDASPDGCRLSVDHHPYFVENVGAAGRGRDRVIAVFGHRGARAGGDD